MKKHKGHILFSLKVYFPTGKPSVFPLQTLSSAIYESLFAPSFWPWTHAIWLHRDIHYTQKVISHKMQNVKLRACREHVQVDLSFLSMGHNSCCENHCLCSIVGQATLVCFQFLFQAGLFAYASGPLHTPFPLSASLLPKFTRLVPFHSSGLCLNITSSERLLWLSHLP